MIDDERHCPANVHEMAAEDASPNEAHGSTTSGFVQVVNRVRKMILKMQHLGTAGVIYHHDEWIECHEWLYHWANTGKFKR